VAGAYRGFSALQRAENSSTVSSVSLSTQPKRFQCSSASRKFLNRHQAVAGVHHQRVSVLFSEPKIPQPPAAPQVAPVARAFQCSSASRKFLNLKSLSISSSATGVSVLFSEPKIPQPKRSYRSAPVAACFSALQRAENSSTLLLTVRIERGRRFSALQRAENSSTLDDERGAYGQAQVSVLFSEPKIPQRGRVFYRPLFGIRFQCSSASRKFLNSTWYDEKAGAEVVSVLFSEPKIPQRRW